MADELDINAVTASFIKQNVDSWLEAGKGVIKITSNKFRLRLSNTYSDYLRCVLEKYSKSKSFFIRTEPVNLYQHYEPLSIRCNQENIDNPEISSILNFSNFSIVTGSGGSGKSMFMRHLFLSSIITKIKVPIFIELRQFSDNGFTLIDLIQQTLNEYKFQLDADYTLKAIENGHFVIFLDGFDEVLLNKRRELTKQILAFTKKFDRNSIIVSSRPDRELEGWPGFSMVSLLPLTQEQAKNLVVRLPFDEELRASFVKDLDQALFTKHKSFLSNPLLLSIMLLTYGQSAHIPSKLNVFYNQAYEALFERHDALKSGFHRQRRTKLDIQDFARLFSAFCIQTYDKRIFEFTRTEALNSIEKAQQITRLDFDKVDFLDDSLQAVCLLVEEGLHIVFAHRSFQEYFVARFILEAKKEVQEQLIKKYSKDIFSDSVIELLLEMRPELVESFYILPGIDDLFDKIGVIKDVGISHYTRYIKLVFKRFTFQGKRIRGSINSGKGNHFFTLVQFTLEKYRSLAGEISNVLDRNTDVKVEEMKKKHGTRKREFSIDTSGLTLYSPFIRDLSEHGRFFSIYVLKILLQVRINLKKKIAAVEQSLEDILRLK